MCETVGNTNADYNSATKKLSPSVSLASFCRVGRIATQKRSAEERNLHFGSVRPSPLGHCCVSIPLRVCDGRRIRVVAPACAHLSTQHCMCPSAIRSRSPDLTPAPPSDSLLSQHRMCRRSTHCSPEPAAAPIGARLTPQNTGCSIEGHQSLPQPFAQAHCITSKSPMDGHALHTQS